MGRLVGEFPDTTSGPSKSQKFVLSIECGFINRDFESAIKKHDATWEGFNKDWIFCKGILEITQERQNLVAMSRPREYSLKTVSRT